MIVLKKLGNVVDTSKISYPNFINKCSGMDAIDANLPTLLIGYSFAKGIYPMINVLERRIGKSLYWTFSRKERRGINEVDLSSFYSGLFRNEVRRIPYFYLNLVCYTKEQLKKFGSFLRDDRCKICYHDTGNRSIFVYMENRVLGISENDLEYIGAPINKTLELMKNNPSNHFVKFPYLSGDSLSSNIRMFLNLNSYIIPALYWDDSEIAG